MQHCGNARHRGQAGRLLLATMLCLAAAACAQPAETVMAPPTHNDTLARPPGTMTGDFCASLTPAQRAANQLCGGAAPH